MSLRGKLASALELPQGMFGGTEIVVREREEVRIGGCRRIAAYGPTEIALCLSRMRVSVCGAALTVVRYVKGEVTIRGSIDTLSFVDAKKGGR